MKKSYQYVKFHSKERQIQWTFLTLWKKFKTKEIVRAVSSSSLLWLLFSFLFSFLLLLFFISENRLVSARKRYQRVTSLMPFSSVRWLRKEYCLRIFTFSLSVNTRESFSDLTCGSMTSSKYYIITHLVWCDAELNFRHPLK